MASSRAILLFLAAVVFSDQARALSSYGSDRQARRQAALIDELEDTRDAGASDSLSKCVKALADVVATRRSLKDLRRSDRGYFNAGMGQMQENEMQMQMVLDTDDFHNGGIPGQYLPGNLVNGYPNQAYPNSKNSYGSYKQRSPFPQFPPPDLGGTPYGYPPSKSGMSMNPMTMPVDHPFPGSPQMSGDHLL